MGSSRDLVRHFAVRNPVAVQTQGGLLKGFRQRLEVELQSERNGMRIILTKLAAYFQRRALTEVSELKFWTKR